MINLNKQTDTTDITKKIITKTQLCIYICIAGFILSGFATLVSTLITAVLNYASIKYEPIPYYKPFNISYIDDNANILVDTENLTNTIKTIHDNTNVQVYIHTTDLSMTSSETFIEDTEKYFKSLKDPNGLLLTIVKDNALEKDYIHFTVGNTTSNIFTDSVINNMESDLKYRWNNSTVDSAIYGTFNNISLKMFNFTKDIIGFSIFVKIFVVLLFIFAIFGVLLLKQEKEHVDSKNDFTKGIFVD